MRVNCWEFKKCGREPGGLKVKELGICPAASEQRVNQINNGKNGGRCCWVVAGTFCGGVVQGIAAVKVLNCMNCDFYKLVWKEENKDGNYKTPAEVLRLLRISSLPK